MKITEKELRKKTASEIKTKAAIFNPQSKTTLSEDTSPKSIKLKIAIQLLKTLFHLKINTAVSTTKGHSKEMASIQEEEEDEEEEEHP
jgi:ribosomal protein L29